MRNVARLLMLACAMTLMCCKPSVVAPAQASAGARPSCLSSTEAIHGVRTSIAVAARVLGELACYDGGELEDVYRSLGIAFTKWPREFVKAIGQARLQKKQIPDLFVMLPLDFVDHPCDGAKELIRRRALLASLDGIKDLKGLVEPEFARSIERKQVQCKAAMTR